MSSKIKSSKHIKVKNDLDRKKLNREKEKDNYDSILKSKFYYFSWIFEIYFASKTNV